MVLGKPPAPAVADALRDHIARLAHAGGVRPARPRPARPDRGGGATCWPAAAWPCPRRRGRAGRPAASRPGGTGALRGLFSGGTLCVEAMVVASELLGPVASNVPIRPEWTLGRHRPSTGCSTSATTRTRSADRTR